jgi:hypothetical protein
MKNFFRERDSNREKLSQADIFSPSSQLVGTYISSQAKPTKSALSIQRQSDKFFSTSCSSTKNYADNRQDIGNSLAFKSPKNRDLSAANNPTQNFNGQQITITKIGDFQRAPSADISQNKENRNIICSGLLQSSSRTILMIEKEQNFFYKLNNFFSFSLFC